MKIEVGKEYSYKGDVVRVMKSDRPGHILVLWVLFHSHSYIPKAEFARLLRPKEFAKVY